MTLPQSTQSFAAGVIGVLLFVEVRELIDKTIA
jgi:hypothetical protein